MSRRIHRWRPGAAGEAEPCRNNCGMTKRVEVFRRATGRVSAVEIYEGQGRRIVIAQGKKVPACVPRPLRVRVAEAIGWTGIRHEDINGIDEWWGTAPGHSFESPIPDYDTDWAFTGPLIERIKIHLAEGRIWQGGNNWRHGWSADAPNHTNYGDDPCPQEWAETPLLAACHLILALKESGHLLRPCAWSSNG